MVPRRIALIFSLLCFFGSANADELDAAMGQAIFERQWVGAPASTKSADGLGPLFDARACSSCHAGGGAGHTALDTGAPLAGSGFIVRLGNDTPGYSDPVYGAQLQMRALQGHGAEVRITLNWEEKDDLRAPRLVLEDWGYGALSPRTKLSLRRAPSLTGVALIAQIPDSEILAREDAEDKNHDGISGRANWIVDAGGARRLGRFGWKASEPTLKEQNARAFSRDLGLSTSLNRAPWGECTPTQKACRAAPQGGTMAEPEVSDRLADLIGVYLATLSPPKRALNESGKRIFETTGCAACHGGKVMSDLLLHNMGDGLADGLAEGSAGPDEWRTAPLMDIASTLKRGGLLHDGRARSIAQAVAWHDGEARTARDNYRALSEAGRTALDSFILGE